MVHLALWTQRIEVCCHSSTESLRGGSGAGITALKSRRSVLSSSNLRPEARAARLRPLLRTLAWLALSRLASSSERAQDGGNLKFSPINHRRSKPPTRRYISWHFQPPLRSVCVTWLVLSEIGGGKQQCWAAVEFLSAISLYSQHRLRSLGDCFVDWGAGLLRKTRNAQGEVRVWSRPRLASFRNG